MVEIFVYEILIKLPVILRYLKKISFFSSKLNNFNKFKVYIIEFL